MIVLIVAVLSTIGVGAIEVPVSVEGHVDAGVGGGFYRREHRRTVFHLAAGGEVTVGRVGLLGEVGGGVSAGRAHDESGGTFTGALTVHPLGARHHLDPYALAGWSAAFRAGGVGALSIGGGVKIRSDDLPTFRVSIIDHTRWGFHLFEFRIGVGF